MVPAHTAPAEGTTCEHYYFQHRIRPECTPIHDREGEDNYAARVEQNESAVGEGKRKVGKLQQAVEGSEAEALQKLVLYRLMHDVLTMRRSSPLKSPNSRAAGCHLDPRSVTIDRTAENSSCRPSTLPWPNIYRP
jgi:hypothetical protein